MDDSTRDNGINEEIGKRIREVRLSRKISQQELATRANISLNHVSDIERGKKALKLVTFVRIIEALQVSADTILRADVPEVNQLYQTEFSRIIEDCSASEVETLKQFMLQLKDALRKAQQRE